MAIIKLSNGTHQVKLEGFDGRWITKVFHARKEVAPKKPCPSNRVITDASKDIGYEIRDGNHQS